MRENLYINKKLLVLLYEQLNLWLAELVLLLEMWFQKEKFYTVGLSCSA